MCYNVIEDMKKRYNWAINTLAIIALVGLMTIQFYWLFNAFLIKEATFRQKAERAMLNVSDRVEKIERDKIFRKQNVISGHIKKLDSIDYLIFQRLEVIARTDSTYRNILEKDKDNKYSFNSLVAGKIADDSTGNSSIQIESVYNDDNEIRRKYEKLFQDMVLKKLFTLKQRFEMEISNRSYLVQDIFKEQSFYFQTAPIQDRIDFNTLDSLIRVECEINNINIDYEFGVYVPMTDMLCFQKTGQYPVELIDLGIKVPLFKNSRTPNFLIIYFPGEREFIYSDIFWALVVSCILMAMVIFSYIYVMQSMYQQRRLSELTKDFINNMTHEFKTPISTIKLACETLKDKNFRKTEEMIETYVDIINEENSRLGSMSEKILQSVILETGRLQLKLDNVDISQLINSAIRNIKLQIESRGGMILTDFQATNTLVKLDKIHFTNVIINLLENANKYTIEAPVIRIFTENAINGIFVVIEDNGIGISKVDQKRVFEKHYRVPTGNRHDVKGFGLGLSYVRAIVEAHGGTITVESEIKKGSKFKIFIPQTQK